MRKLVGKNGVPVCSVYIMDAYLPLPVFTAPVCKVYTSEAYLLPPSLHSSCVLDH